MNLWHERGKVVIHQEGKDLPAFSLSNVLRSGSDPLRFSAVSYTPDRLIVWLRISARPSAICLMNKYCCLFQKRLPPCRLLHKQQQEHINSMS